MSEGSYDAGYQRGYADALRDRAPWQPGQTRAWDTGYAAYVQGYAAGREAGLRERREREQQGVTW